MFRFELLYVIYTHEFRFVTGSHPYIEVEVRLRFEKKNTTFRFEHPQKTKRKIKKTVKKTRKRDKKNMFHDKEFQLNCYS